VCLMLRASDAPIAGDGSENTTTGGFLNSY
jgi:hypothetical protein